VFWILVKPEPGVDVPVLVLNAPSTIVFELTVVIEAGSDGLAEVRTGPPASHGEDVFAPDIPYAVTVVKPAVASVTVITSAVSGDDAIAYHLWIVGPLGVVSACNVHVRLVDVTEETGPALSKDRQ
jgi:hypothetical protein